MAKEADTKLWYVILLWAFIALICPQLAIEEMAAGTIRLMKGD